MYYPKYFLFCLLFRIPKTKLEKYTHYILLLELDMSFETVLYSGGTGHASITLFQDNTKLLFRASDFGRILGIQNISNSLKTFDDDEKTIIQHMTGGGEQPCLMLTESGVYRLLMRSNRPDARPIQKWLTAQIVASRQALVAKVEELRRYTDGTNTRVETVVRNQIAASWRGNTEVKCLCGYVDVVTEEAVIEVKHWRQWKHALGQVLAYGYCFPEKSKRIVLFCTAAENATASAMIKGAVEPVCIKHDVEVTLLVEETVPVIKGTFDEDLPVKKRKYIEIK